MTSGHSPIPEHVPPHLVVDFDFSHPWDAAHLSVQEAWNAVRHDSGMFWTPRNGGHWVVTRGSFVREALQDYEHFSSSQILIPKGVWPIPIIPQEIDPPRHREYRHIMNLALAPKVVATLMERARAECRDLVASIAPHGACEFIDEFARVLPLRLFLHLMNLPVIDGEQLLRWTQEVTSDSTLEVRQAALQKLIGYVEERLHERLQRSMDDLFSRIVHARVEGGRPMTRDEMLGLATQSLFGGLDTTSAMLGFSMHFLATNPTHRRQLVENPSLIVGAVDEFLRRFGIAVPGRLVAQDFMFHGVFLRQGDFVQLPTFMHGLDPDSFTKPLEVHFSRTNANEHSAFGNGVHRCPGSHLARMEITAALEHWLARIPEFHLTPDARAIDCSGLVLSVQQLPLTWDTRDDAAKR